MDFSNKIVVITGGTGGLGRAVIGRLLEGGAQCHIPEFSSDIPEDFPYRTEERVHITTKVDLSDDQAVIDYYARFETVWASIHLAGGFHMGPVGTISKKEFAGQLNLNVMTSFLCCREASKRMKKGGRIVNVVSRQALEPRIGAGTSAYTAAKGAVQALTQALAEELASDGIWVNAIAPSVMDTPMNRRSMPEANHTLWPKVEEVAETIAFLASPLNKVTRGAIIPVYGKI